MVLRLCDTSGAMEDKVREGEWPWGFANVDLFLCCFDVTSLASLQHVKTKWAPLVRKLCLDAPIVRTIVPHNARARARTHTHTQAW